MGLTGSHLESSRLMMMLMKQASSEARTALTSKVYIVILFQLELRFAGIGVVVHIVLASQP